MKSCLQSSTRVVSRLFCNPITVQSSKCRPMSAIGAQFKDVGPSEAHELMKSGVKYLDVRTVEEFVAGHAPNSSNIALRHKSEAGMVPNPAFPTELSQAFPSKAEAIIVGCKSGARSVAAIQVMLQEGYLDLTNVKGGWDAWSSDPSLPQEK